MGINVNYINDSYNFDVNGVSYVGEPINGTAMFISKKVENLLLNLEGKENCLIFCENNIVVPDILKEKNLFVLVPNPQNAYAEFVNFFSRQQFERDSKRTYSLQPDGFYLGENVSLGANCHIEPGCIIGHDVTIGDDACILAGSIIKNAVIGDRILCNENSVIGSFGFTMTDDVYGNKVRIPTLGKVIIGNDVEIGTHNNISCGSGGNTIIGNFVKLDTLVHIGHDVKIEDNVEITAGVIVGGFTKISASTWIGINSTLRNRITIDRNSIIGMGSVVTKNIPAQTTVYGNPAHCPVK